MKDEIEKSNLSIEDKKALKKSLMENDNFGKELFNYGVQSMSKQSIDEQQTNLETAIERCVSQYYVLVGHYPESLNVLEKEYGLIYNKKIFFVDYQVLGENIAPDIVVIRKEGAYE